MDRRSLLLGRRPAPDPTPGLPPDPDPVPRPPPVVLPYAGGLAPFTPTADAPWDARRARHLLRRATLSAPQARVQALLARTPAGAADALVNDALAAGLPPRPSYADLLPPVNPTTEQTTAFNTANSAGYTDAYSSVMRELMERRAPGTALNERMALLMHTFVPTNYDGFGNRAYRLADYWDVLRRNALGSFETLIREVGTTQAMLVYLSGSSNRVGQPNENYARELLELFTLGITGPDGQPNYTQADVTGLARALTGWTAPSTQVAGLFVASRFDTGQKTILGQTGAFTYATAHDVLFSARRTQAAVHVARHLYMAFVAATPNEGVVAELAAVLTASAFSLQAAVRALLKSQHFFSSGALGVRVKDPLSLVLGLLAELGWSNPDQQFRSVYTRCRDVGFEIFRPADVSGWPEGREWLDTGRVPLRGVGTDQTVAARSEGRAFAATFPTAGDPYTFVADVAARLVAIPLGAPALAQAVTVLLGGIPDYEWDPTVAGAEGRIRGLVQHLARLPEYHLA